MKGAENNKQYFLGYKKMARELMCQGEKVIKYKG